MTFKPDGQLTESVLFRIAATLLLIAVAEAGVELLGFNFVSRYFSAGRLMELAATLLLFVIVLLLRQIRDRPPAD